MSPECKACPTRQRCAVAIPHSAVQCRAVKWAVSAAFLLALGLMVISTRDIARAHVVLTDAESIRLLLRTTLIMGIWMTAIWSLNYNIRCAELGGIEK